jgi:uncharacterized membrane protein YfcA
MEKVFFQLIILLAGFTQGFTGFGSVLVALPLFTLFLDIKTVIPLVCLFALVINVIIILQIHEHILWGKVRILLATAVPGIIAGVYVLKTVPASTLETAVGLVLIAFGLHRLFGRTPKQEIADSWGWLFGFLSGVLGGSIGTGGPPVIIYTSLQPWGKYPVKSTITAYFLVSSAVISSTHAVNSLVTDYVLELFVSGIPVLVAGVLAGSWLFGRVDSRSYRKVLLYLLISLGFFMIGKAVAVI